MLGEKLGIEDPGFEEVEEGSLVAAGLDALDERERRIVELRFFEEMTQSQIAAEVGISQMHVSRLLRRALANMRGRIEEVTPRDE
jgi:RNA polymerase sigma-B factor